MAQPQAEPTDHYFSERPRSASHPRELRFLYQGQLLIFEVDRGVFAFHGLDPGTALLIEALRPRSKDRILDLGCGWGAVGIAAAKAAPEGRVVLTDVNHRATQLARNNLRRNRLSNAEVRAGSMFDPIGTERFDVIATNPPYHVGREHIVEMLEQVPRHLMPGGVLLMVGKGSQGIRYYQSWMTDHWKTQVDVIARRSGYRVLSARPAPQNLQA